MHEKKKIGPRSYANDYLQFKGRLLISGICGTPCITQYAPANKLIFNEEEILEFKNPNEMINIIKNLLGDQIKYNQY